MDRLSRLILEIQAWIKKGRLSMIVCDFGWNFFILLLLGNNLIGGFSVHSIVGLEGSMSVISADLVH